MNVKSILITAGIVAATMYLVYHVSAIGTVVIGKTNYAAPTPKPAGA